MERNWRQDRLEAQTQRQFNLARRLAQRQRRGKRGRDRIETERRQTKARIAAGNVDRIRGVQIRVV